MPDSQHPRLFETRTHAFPAPTHGGTDALGTPQWDFSTNNNTAGPCPTAVTALTQADVRYYPDPSYTRLRQSLAQLHQISKNQIVIGASGSELIMRISCYHALQHSNSAALPRTVWVPEHAYGDYAHAARQHGLPVCSDVTQAGLIWLCHPDSPRGQTLALPHNWQQHHKQAFIVLDCAYVPLRLNTWSNKPATTLINPSSGLSNPLFVQNDFDPNYCWQIWTPNKALGLCGIRAAYAIAPTHADTKTIQQLASLAPSWPLGAHGAALLQNWCTIQTQTWLVQARQTLHNWKRQQTAMLQQLGWQCDESETNFFTARPYLPNGQKLHSLLQYLRTQGIKLRDCASFGLPSYVRLCVHTPQAQTMLKQALMQFKQTKS